MFALAGIWLAVLPAAAQPPGGPGGWGPGMMMGPGMMGPGMMGRGGGMMCNPRAAGLAEWRMDRIESVTKPTEAQRTALNALRTASTKAAELIAQACPREFPTASNARLEAMEKRLQTMLQAVQTVRPAFEAFYASLDAEQKVRLDAAAPRGWGWRRWHGGR
jgi:hypothetical protein